MNDAHDRRAFLRLALAVPVACAACGSDGGSGTTPIGFGDVSAGKVADLAVGTIKVVGTSPVFVARDDKGVYAMTTTCTHSGCDLGGGVSKGRISCPCHGSEFDANGGVLQGPASAPLQHYAVSVDASGAITVHGGQEVSSDTRVAV